MFVLADKIIEANKREGFLGAIVYGPQRLGKTSYASQVLHQIYGDWDKVLSHTLFDLRDVVSFLKDAVNRDVRIRALCWDDAGIHANKMLYFGNQALVRYLQNLLDVVGVNLGGLIITTPSPENLLKAVRGYEFYRIKVMRQSDANGRMAIGYLSSLLPSGTRIIHRKFKDYFNVRLPKEFWDPYLVKRKSYLKAALTNLEAVINPPETPAAAVSAI